MERATYVGGLAVSAMAAFICLAGSSRAAMEGIADYSYSKALKNSGLTWDETTLDRWLTNPSALVPGTKMFFQLSSAQDRADVIAYLQLQK
jgi:cytochrome c2